VRNTDLVSMDGQLIGNYQLQVLWSRHQCRHVG